MAQSGNFQNEVSLDIGQKGVNTLNDIWQGLKKDQQHFDSV